MTFRSFNYFHTGEFCIICRMVICFSKKLTFSKTKPSAIQSAFQIDKYEHPMTNVE